MVKQNRLKYLALSIAIMALLVSLSHLYLKVSYIFSSSEPEYAVEITKSDYRKEFKPRVLCYDIETNEQIDCK